MPRPKKSKQLTALEMACVANFSGNQIEAARLAGVKTPEKQASVIFNRPRVKAAVEEKMRAMVERSGRALAKDITISRNDVVNRLDKLSTEADSDSAKVSALRGLIDIFGLKASDQKGDVFAGWSEEELRHFVRTQQFPDWVVAKLGTKKPA